MPLFQYKAASADGDVVEGRLDAPSQAAAIKRLQDQGHLPIRVEAARTVHSGSGFWQLRRDRMGPAEVDIFTLELSTLLQAGLALDRALDLMVGLADEGAFKDVMARAHAAVRRGVDLSEALDSEDRVFSRFYLNIVKAGEASGALDLALARLCDFMERSRVLRETLMSAMLYPMILLAFSFASLALILGVVVPRISQMFLDAGAQLPLATRVVVAGGEVVSGYWWVAVAVGLAVYAVFKLRADDPRWRYDWDRRLLSLPLAGGLIARYEAARFTRTLGALLESDVPLLDGLAISREAVTNRVIAAGLEQVASSVRAGQGVARPLIESKVFPKLAGHLMQVGEQTGNLQEMLLRLADIYDREVQTSLKRAVDLLGPILILVLGLLIAGIIMSVMSAILSVNELAF